MKTFQAIEVKITVDLDIGCTTVTVVSVLGSTALLFLCPPDQSKKQQLSKNLDIRVFLITNQSCYVSCICLRLRRYNRLGQEKSC